MTRTILALIAVALLYGWIGAIESQNAFEEENYNLFGGSLMENSELIDNIARKIRIVVGELGEKSIGGAIMVGPDIGRENLIGFSYVTCPTLPDVVLGNVDFKTARMFEDA